MMAPIHVMHVVLSLDAGGLEHVVLHLIRQGRTLGQRVSVLCIERPGVLAPQAEALGAAVHCVHKPPGFIPATIPAIQKVLQTESPDVIHSHQIGALLYTGAAARRAGIQNVLHTEHGKHYDTSQRRRWVAWWAARRARAFFCVSNDIIHAIKTHRIAPARKLAVMENGIDLTKSADPQTVSPTLRTSLNIPPPPQVQVGTVGRLAPVKSQDVLLLAAFARIPASEKPASPSPGRRRVRSKPISANSPKPSASPPARTSRATSPIPRLYPQNDGHLRPHQQFRRHAPLHPRSSKAQNLPVIALRVGGLFLKSSPMGRPASCFESGNDALLAKHFAELLQNAQLRQTLGQAGRAYAASRFDVATMAANYHQQYLKLP